MLGSAFLLPLGQRRAAKAPIEAAILRAVVEMSGLTNCMVSETASPAVTDPPGELSVQDDVLLWVLALQGQVGAAPMALAT